MFDVIIGMGLQSMARPNGEAHEVSLGMGFDAMNFHLG